MEGQAKSLTEVEAARKKASKALEKAGALRDRCSQQVREGGKPSEVRRKKEYIFIQTFVPVICMWVRAAREVCGSC